MKVKNDNVSEPSIIKGVVSDWTDFPRHQDWGANLPQPPCRTVFPHLNTAIQHQKRSAGEVVLETGLFSESRRNRETQNSHSEILFKKQYKHYCVCLIFKAWKCSDYWFQTGYTLFQPYGPFEPETPNNEKTKEENTPHSQWVFLMATQFWQLYHLLYIIKLKETMNRKGVEERHC